jgi:hypothetical protein
MTSALGLSLTQLANALGGEVRNGQVLAPGPDHKSPRDRSLSVKLDPSAPDGLLVNSFANDDPIACKDYVRARAGLEPFKPNRRPTKLNDNSRQPLKAPLGSPIATYDYRDKDGTLLYQNVRYEPKTFRQRRPDGNDGWIYDLDGTGERKGLDGLKGRRVLYRLQEILQYPDGTVFVCEGEKDTNRVAGLGHCAITVASGKWTDECVQALSGRDILILEDNDDAGRKKALHAATLLHPVAKSVRIVRLPGLSEGGDVSDWLDAGHKSEELVDFSLDTPIWTPDASAKIIQSSAQFTGSFVPPDPLISGILQRQFIYALTGHTGRGKTAIALLFAAHVALGRRLGDLDVEKGRVLVLAGENPTDAKMRWIALSQQMHFDRNTIDVHWIEGTLKFSESVEQIRREVEQLGGVDLIVVDSSAAFFEGDDENSNAQAGAHARRLRALTTLAGGPCVLVLCHPPKNGGEDNLQPRGGGAYVAEMDGNLTVTKDDMAVELHWQTKLRGPDFAPVNFRLRSVTHEELKDTKGRLIPTIVAEHLSDIAQEEMVKASRCDEDMTLKIVEERPRVSFAELAAALGWTTKDGKPNRSKAQRVLGRLERDRLIGKHRGRYEVTEKGRKALKQEGAG